MDKILRIYADRSFKVLEDHRDPVEKGHGRLEERMHEVSDAQQVIGKWEGWEPVKRIIRVTRQRERLGNKPVIEDQVSYYFSNTMQTDAGGVCEMHTGSSGDREQEPLCPQPDIRGEPQPQTGESVQLFHGDRLRIEYSKVFESNAYP